MIKTQIKTNKVKIQKLIIKHPGLRFHELKKQVGLANGTVEHHVKYLEKEKKIIATYDRHIPRYYSYDVSNESRIILLRLRQYTTSKIIKSLLKSKCLNFSQLVSEAKRSPGTVSLYKNILLKDKIIIGDTSDCTNCKESMGKIKYKLVNPESVRLLINEYGKSSLKKCSDNLSDIFLSLK